MNRWRPAVPVILVGILGLVAVSPVLILGDPTAPAGTVLELDAVPATENAVHWSEGAQTPNDLRTAALADAFRLLTVLGWIAFATSLVVIVGRTLMEVRRRAPEFGIRRAVGASRRTLLLSLGVEAGVVAGTLALIGLLASPALARAAGGGWPVPLRALGAVPVGPLLLAAAALGLARLSAVRFLRPGHMVRPADPTVSLWLPALQLAFAVALLSAAGAVLERSAPATAGNEQVRDDVVIGLDTGRLSGAERSQGYRTLLAELEDDADVAFVHLAAPGEALGLGTVDQIMTDCGNCFATGVAVPYLTLDAAHRFVSPDSFAAREITLVAGRGFTSADLEDGERVVVVNQHLAQRYFQGGQALGRGLYLRRGFWRRPYIVVGVVDDHPANAFGAGRQPYAALYLPVLQHPPARAELLVRPRENATADSAARMRTLAAGILGPDAVGPMESLAALRTREARHAHWFGVGFAGAGVAVLLIALVGVAGSSAAWVRSRAFELALRRAVGASRRDVTRFVLWRVAGLIAGGTLLGLFTYATVLRRPLAAALPGLAPWAPDAALAAAATLGGAAALAALRTLADLRAEPPASRLQ